MQSPTAVREDPAITGTARVRIPTVEGPLTERQTAERREAWLEHEVSPPGHILTRGVPYSALNE